MKRKITLLRLTIVIAVLASVGIALAAVLPPPANQYLGIYDTVYDGFDEAGCRDCHSSGVPQQHHNLVEEGKYNCTDCHQDEDGNVILIRDCVVCHTSSPHHITDVALDLDCKHCHGNFVDNPGDHYIPTYNSSSVTPDPKFRNKTENGKTGGCEACHEPDYSAHPEIDANNDTHHAAFGIAGCNVEVCHDPKEINTSYSIRACENCHGVNSLHNIQFDYETTKGQAGYGHIGQTWDCMGCHGWYEYKSRRISKNVKVVITPEIFDINPNGLVTGEETVVSIEGENFVSTVEGTTYTSEVVVETSAGDTITLEPDTITATEITVTIPGLDTGSCGVYLVKDELVSNRLPLVVAPEVSIESAIVAEDGTVTVIGKGFCDIDPTRYDDSLGVVVASTSMKVRKIQEPLNVLMWEDNKIVFTSQEALETGASVVVATLFDEEGAPIVTATP